MISLSWREVGAGSLNTFQYFDNFFRNPYLNLHNSDPPQAGLNLRINSRWIIYTELLETRLFGIVCALAGLHDSSELVGGGAGDFYAFRRIYESLIVTFSPSLPFRAILPKSHVGRNGDESPILFALINLYYVIDLETLRNRLRISRPT